ncbi:MAG: HDOD domain-containing protein [Solidesulfovibrio sp.]|uniref:EAL and HDOD domain-containing protein n=1 Tax=Solidesulfovibrio sp. TaxID=2910990 RepID=UPI0031593970
MESSCEEIVVARQPIFDTSGNVWGYELLYRSSASAVSAQVNDENLATVKVISDGFSLVCEDLKVNQKLLVNFPCDLLISEAAFALPAETCVIEILENVCPSKDVLDALRVLLKHNYTLALDDYIGQEELEPFLPLVNIVKIDILGLDNLDQVNGIVKSLKGNGAILLAEKVEDIVTYEKLVDLGFVLFQGYFFARPEVVPGKKVSAQEVSKINLLNELGRDDLNVVRLSEIVKSDPSISFRLLKYINMAGKNTGCRIDSVERAITVLGRRQLVQWLRAVILSDMSSSMKANELSFMAVNRGFFLEALSNIVSCCGFQPETMFLIGMLTLIDSIMEISLSDILKPLALDNKIKNIILNTGTGLTPFIELVRAYERWDIGVIKALVSFLSLDIDATDAIYNKSFAKTLAIMKSVTN